jgi:hypothetical protein
MLRTFSHIILSLVLLVSTIGMAVSKHYCGGELASVSIYQNDDDDSCCDMDNCCHDEKEVYQVKGDYSVPAISTLPMLAELDVLGHNLFAGENLLALENESVTPTECESPPLLPIQKTLAVKQVYLL